MRAGKGSLGYSPKERSRLGGQARGAPVLVQRAASEGPRWTRAIEEQPGRPVKREASADGEMGKERQALFLLAARTIRRCSFDGRSQKPLTLLLLTFTPRKSSQILPFQRVDR
jgi:hypothetical protein